MLIVLTRKQLIGFLNEREGIILEDDTLPNKSFFTFRKNVELTDTIKKYLKFVDRRLLMSQIIKKIFF